MQGLTQRRLADTRQFRTDILRAQVQLAGALGRVEDG